MRIFLLTPTWIEQEARSGLRRCPDRLFVKRKGWVGQAVREVLCGSGVSTLELLQDGEPLFADCLELVLQLPDIGLFFSLESSSSN